MVQSVQLILDLADQQFAAEFMVAAKLLIKVCRQHIKTENPRIKEYWNKHSELLNGADPKGF